MLQLHPKFTRVCIFSVYITVWIISAFSVKILTIKANTAKQTLINDQEFVYMLMVMDMYTIHHHSSFTESRRYYCTGNAPPQSHTCSQRAEENRANRLIDATHNSSYTSHVCCIAPQLHFRFQR